MAQASRPRRGSLQYWPRKRAKKILPSVNWKGISKENKDKKLQGFIGYKVGMKSAYVKDVTPDSMTNNKRIAIPVTIVECPPLKIFSIRLYKNNIVMSEVLGTNLDKELKRKIKLPKKEGKKFDEMKDYDDIKIIAYSVVKKTSIKKKPDMVEIGLGGSLDDKKNFVKDNLGKEISVNDIFEKMQLVDIRGITKGKGTQGPVKRFGIGLKSHKSEKGQRNPGSLGPWHPARVIFRVPMAGQLGTFTRAVYNNTVVDMGNISENNINPSGGFKKFGNIKTSYVVLYGSIQGPSKRQVILTNPLRATKKQSKKQYELIGLK